MVPTFITFLAGLILSLALTPVVRVVARRLGAVDVPDPGRRAHVGEVPRLGGVAVFAAFYLTVFGIGGFWQGAISPEAMALARACLLPSSVILLLGVVDDIRTVRPWIKLVVQVAVGLWLYYVTGVRIEMIFGVTPALPSFSLPATLLWVVLITNAFNVVDGVDGLASGVALISIVAMFLVAIERENLALPLLAAAMAGGLLGFLRYNFSPASIFLGDSGSLWVGFMLAVFSTVGYQKSSTAITIAAPLATMGLPVAETAFSALRRFLKGQSIFQPDGRHIHHQLLRKGLRPRQVAFVLYAGSGLCGAASWFLVKTSDAMAGVISIMLALAIWAGIQSLGYSELSEFNKAVRRGFWYQRKIIQNSVAARQLGEEIKAALTLDQAWSAVVDVVEQLGYSRVELRSSPTVSDPCPGTLASWEAEDAGGGNLVVVAIHLRHNGQQIGELVTFRDQEAETLHSELALFIDTVASALPRLLVSRSGTPPQSLDGLSHPLPRKANL